MSTANNYDAYVTKTGSPAAASLLALADALRIDPDRSLSVSEAAEFLGVSPRTIGELARTGKVAHHRIGTGRGRLLFRRRDLDEFRERNISRPTLSRLHQHRSARRP